MAPAMSSPRSGCPTTAPRPKTTLFCPVCGHESDLDGDWCRRDDGSLACPSCGAVVERR